MQHLVDQDQLAVAEAELELRVGQDDAALERRSPRRARRASSVSSFSRSASPSPTRSRPRSNVSGRSWPAAAFVVGVKIGSGRRSDSTSPAGSGTPQTDPSVTVLLPPRAREVAARDALDGDDLGALHEHRAARQRRVVRNARGKSRGSALIRWFPTRSAVRSNQNSERPVSTRPLSGIGVRQHHVERADPVGRDDQQPVVAGLVDVADLAPRVQDGVRAHASSTGSFSSRSNTTSRFAR